MEFDLEKAPCSNENIYVSCSGVHHCQNGCPPKMVQINVIYLFTLKMCTTPT